MALPDSGNVEDYTEAEMMEVVKLNETDKAKLTKNQKAAVARYNFKKNKGEPIPFKGSGIAAAPAPAPAAPAAATDIVSLLSPEMQALAGRDPATLSKEEKIALAKAKSQAVRAQAAAGGASAPADDKPKGPSAAELAAQKAMTFAHAKELDARFGAGKAIESWGMMVGIPYATVKAERILDVVRYLHMEMGFDQFRDLTAVDYPPDRSGATPQSGAARPDEASGRMEVVYNLTSLDGHRHVALKAKLPRVAPEGADLPHLPSIVSIFPGADWLEREVFDLFGIRFTGHPYMRRLMMPDGWVGHPLRKDYDAKKEQFIGLDERGNDLVSFNAADGW